MLFAEKTITLRDGRAAVLRSPRPARDAAPMLDYLRVCSAETDFLLRTPEEWTETAEQERAFLEHLNASTAELMIICEVEGELAGSCQLTFNDWARTRHRGSVAIGLAQKYWGLGIGTAMFREMLAAARQRPGVLQLELDYAAGNDRARRLYEKMGFVQTGVKPAAIRLPDGTLRDDISMMCRL